ncbi:class I SAM-dependent DNA methyltransferase [Helicobacter pylori]|uniref:site-specific DNA-methyltransferase (adenine-specific) n=1 Tax=Helicobacter pylori TaxID=210 RepID=A0AAE7TRP2_HELPX|nr:Eco57I restriction-modification methylase domain-containing protein [Helicobacter pylori]AFI01715.1 putative type IIS restriction-modification protein [Helicobacter pylori Shi112]QQW94310.1 class I SAM-dependent DNA methyltransferase [Helicobacter pylori]QQX50277.1 Eco57I restriction-modification methylase domain-containing protein [Helicobacter pylori]
MIEFARISLKDFIKKYNPQEPKKETIENFEEEINSLLENAKKQESEEFQKNKINKFLENTYGYECNTNKKVDSAIYVGKEAWVLIEAKALNNKNEFPKDRENPLSKAFCQMVFYFLEEIENNNSLKHAIICNAHEFFLFDCKDLLNLFQNDKKIKKLHKDCVKKEGTDSSTKRFYSDLEEYLKKDFEGELRYTHFNLSSYNPKELPLIYQVLSHEVLLKQRKTLDANTLNKDFYEELLYILGLEEQNDKGKILIKPSRTENSLSDALKKEYNNLDDEEVMALLIAWNNRILFLRLLESLLISFKHFEEPFLTIENFKDFNALNTLFFEVLAKKNNERSLEKEDKISGKIPYLNSSLFDKTPLESNGHEIKLLNNEPLEIHPKSVLKKHENYQKDLKPLPLLEYLFEFLHFYKFTTTLEDIKDNKDTSESRLINPSVLGLVFEKLNGYKEGSFYTPSFITSYMCKESITPIVLDKFNQKYNIECEDLEELKNYLKSYKKDKRKEYLQLLLTLRICDPAVGSGHFLVSALNEMVWIAYELELITSLYRHSLRLENDEIIIHYTQTGEIFNYTKAHSENDPHHHIQKELFELKKSIIENCLFGVDINPNSCEITKLRLWIELLKYSYYIFEEGKNTNALETLPNIDINIKCGNSLIFNFPLNSKLTIGQTLEFSKNLKAEIKEYKNSVMFYKEGLGEKAKILQNIAKLKSLIINYFIEQHQANKHLKETLKAFISEYGDGIFDISAAFGMEMLKIARKNNYRFNPTLTKKQPSPIGVEANRLLIKIKECYETLENLKNSKTLEWRFEFPEVLNDEGDFLGFDCIIGNPPYINTRELSKNNSVTKEKYRQIYREVSGSYDIFILFILMGLRLQKVSNFAWIIPNKFTSTEYGRPIFEKLKSENKIRSIVDVSYIKTFESASVYPILLIGKNNSVYSEYYIESQDDLSDNNLKERTLSIANLRFITMAQYGLKFQSGTTGFEAQKIFSYIQSGSQQDSIPFAVSGSIDKYVCDTSRVPYMRKCFKYPHISIKVPVAKTKIDFWTNEKIVIAGMTKVIEAYYTKTPLALGVGIYAIYDFCGINPLLILGVLNSSFMSWYARENFKDKHMSGGYLGLNKGNLEKLPMFELEKSNQPTADRIIALVDKILALKEKDPKANTQKLEKEIDALVYQIYNLTDEEIKTIEEGQEKPLK